MVGLSVNAFPPKVGWPVIVTTPLRNAPPTPLTKCPLLQARWPVTMPPPVGLGVVGDTEESSSLTMRKDDGVAVYIQAHFFWERAL